MVSLDDVPQPPIHERYVVVIVQRCQQVVHILTSLGSKHKYHKEMKIARPINVTTAEPSRMYYHERRLKILCEAFDNLEYRERAIVAEHLGFCENCWSPHYIEIINGRKVKREFEEMAFIDLAGKHGVVPSSADRNYRGAIDKLRKALEEDKWL